MTYVLLHPIDINLFGEFSNNPATVNKHTAVINRFGNWVGARDFGGN